MIRVRQRGAREAGRVLERIADGLDAPEQAFDGVLDDVFDVQKEWWSTLGRGSWPADKPSTLEQDRRTGLDTALMRDRGGLEAASTRRGAAGQEIAVSSELLFAVTVPYAAPLASQGRSAVVEATDRDAERFAETFLTALLDD